MTLTSFWRALGVQYLPLLRRKCTVRVVLGICARILALHRSDYPLCHIKRPLAANVVAN